MTAVVQRIRSASVEVCGQISGSAGIGIMILAGFAESDSKEDADILCEKIAGLRIFSGADGKMNLSVRDIGGQALLIPNFTLTASCRRGRRPDFGGCMKPELAEPLFGYFRDRLAAAGVSVETGVFGADMTIQMIGDGPVTIILDSGMLRTPRNR